MTLYLTFMAVVFLAASGALKVARWQLRIRARRRYERTLRNIDRMERELWPEWFRPPRVFGRVRIPGTYEPPIVYTILQSAYSPAHSLAPGTRWIVADDSAVAYLARTVH